MSVAVPGLNFACPESRAGVAFGENATFEEEKNIFLAHWHIKKAAV